MNMREKMIETVKSASKFSINEAESQFYIECGNEYVEGPFDSRREAEIRASNISADEIVKELLDVLSEPTPGMVGAGEAAIMTRSDAYKAMISAAKKDE